VLRRVPGLQAISSYRREWLARDIVAGVVLTTLLVPQGMAYARPGLLARADDRRDDPAADRGRG
jgi:MFS superfamily sulfate permease-like transporter